MSPLAPAALGSASGAVLPVSLLVSSARLILEQHLPLNWVSGEVSNFTRASSGHCYFLLKDEAAQVRCVFFKHRALLSKVTLRDGLKVEVRATPTIYEARGEFQLNVEAVRAAGRGDLYEAFLRLKDKLEALGWFAPEAKRPLPVMPRCIGIVTSPAGAALRDVLTTLRRRLPAVPVILYPTAVQGEGAAENIARMIAQANRRAECDVLLLCRGGGSIEDLWAFNEEVLARAMHESTLPIVSGVGHETDFTIADFVADARAATPTAAATLVLPDGAALRRQVEALVSRLQRSVSHATEMRMQRLDHLAHRLLHPATRMLQERAQLVRLTARLQTAWAHAADRRRWQLARLAERKHVCLSQALPQTARLEQAAGRLPRAAQTLFERMTQRLDATARALMLLDPQEVLDRGYAIATRADGEVVRDAGTLQANEALALRFARGAARVRVSTSETDHLP